MDEFITSTTTPKELLGSIRAIGECIELVNRSCYTMNEIPVNAGAAICFILNLELYRSSARKALNEANGRFKVLEKFFTSQFTMYL